MMKRDIRFKILAMVNTYIIKPSGSFVPFMFAVLHQPKRLCGCWIMFVSMLARL